MARARKSLEMVYFPPQGGLPHEWQIRRYHLRSDGEIDRRYGPATVASLRARAFQDARCLTLDAWTELGYSPADAQEIVGLIHMARDHALDLGLIEG